MSPTDTTEKGFQNDIISHLTSTGYVKREAADYNKSSCLDPELALNFVKDTQPREWQKFERIYKEQSDEKFLIRLVKEIERKGTINILRNGFGDCRVVQNLPRHYLKTIWSRSCSTTAGSSSEAASSSNERNGR